MEQTDIDRISIQLEQVNANQAQLQTASRSGAHVSALTLGTPGHTALTDKLETILVDAGETGLTEQAWMPRGERQATRIRLFGCRNST
ncbi:MAG: hypothetical protein IPP33_03700 [Flavobacteriales bacterium]|nr:hypothetical protein [Flavobacteriales bacterium]